MTRLESTTQNQVRVDLAKQGIRLFRNNVGAMKTPYGGYIRFGLANETEAQNNAIKSSDLIGWFPMTIKPEHVGRTVAVFTSIESKKEGWTYNSNDSHQKAQADWLTLVNKSGGFGMFAIDSDPVIQQYLKFIGE